MAPKVNSILAQPLQLRFRKLTVICQFVVVSMKHVADIYKIGHIFS
jgi:hypothetical protein